MKEELRAKIEKLAESEAVRKEKSSRIAQKLFALPQYTISENILLYVSLPDEVGTRAILEDGFSSKNVFLPITNIETHQLDLGDARGFEELEKGAYGILEPTKISQFSTSDLELVIVPGRAFDARGNRLGRGAGYYDKFLSRVSCTKVGLAFEYQVVEKVESGPTDIPVDKIITEKRVIECSP